MNIEILLARLDGVKAQGAAKWIAKCPAHEDKTPSLSLAELKSGMILLHCHAGCSALDVVQSVGLELADLYPDGPLGEIKGYQTLKREMDRKRFQQQSEEAKVDAELMAAAADIRATRGERLSPKEIAEATRAFRRANG